MRRFVHFLQSRGRDLLDATESDFRRTGLCELSCRTGPLAMRRGPRKPNCSTSSTDGWSNRGTYDTVRCG